MLLIIVCVSMIFEKNYYFLIVYLSLFSLLCAGLYLILKAPDVGLTEAAIGSCISTVILVSFVGKIYKDTHKTKVNKLQLLVSIGMFFVLCSVIKFLPEFGNSSNVTSSNEVTQYFVENTKAEIKLESVVAAILASFRGFDTFGETVVIYTALLCVLLILSNGNNVRKNAKK